MHQSAKRPWPTLDPDDVLDYMITEALAVKAGNEEKEAQEAAKKEAWKEDKSRLEHLR